MSHVRPSTKQNHIALYLLAMLLTPMLKAVSSCLEYEEFIAVQPSEWIPYPIPDSSFQQETKMFS